MSTKDVGCLVSPLAYQMPHEYVAALSDADTEQIDEEYECHQLIVESHCSHTIVTVTAQHHGIDRTEQHHQCYLDKHWDGDYFQLMFQ